MQEAGWPLISTENGQGASLLEILRWKFITTGGQIQQETLAWAREELLGGRVGADSCASRNKGNACCFCCHPSQPGEGEVKQSLTNSWISSPLSIARSLTSFSFNICVCAYLFSLHCIIKWCGAVDVFCLNDNLIFITYVKFNLSIYYIDSINMPNKVIL